MHEDDEEPLSGKARRFVLGTTLMRDACVSRLEITFKRDLISVKNYEKFYAKYGVGLYYMFTIINLLTIVLERPSSILVNGKELPYYIPLFINLLCEAYFYYRWFLIHSVSEKDKFTDNLSSHMTLGILVLMTLDAILYIICQEATTITPIRWSRALRPILLLTFPENRRLRAAFFNLRSTAIDVLPVFGLFLASVVFLSVVSITLMDPLNLVYPNGKLYFVNFWDVFWELYVLTTTANSPDVIIPAYEHHRMFITIYIFTCVVCNWLFMGILTASVYNSYKGHLGEFVVKSVAKRKKKLDEAFYLVATKTPDGKPGISLSTFLRLMHIVKPRRSHDSLKVLFHILNKSSSGYLTQGEFGRLSEYTQMKMTEIELSRTFFQTFVPKFYVLFLAPWFQVFRAMIQHDIYKLFFMSLVIINGLTAMLCRDYPTLQESIEWFFTFMFLIELVLNYLANGGVHFFDNRWNVFDCVVVLAALFAQSLQVGLHTLGITLPGGITQLLLLLRLLRLLKVFSAVPKFKLIINCIIVILPSLMAYAIILIIIYYIFSCIGMELYGNAYRPPEGHVYVNNTNCNNTLLAGTEFVRWHYCLFNFNSITESFIFLLILTVGNNWQIFAEGIVAVSSQWARVFFLLIHWSCVLLVLNIVLAFIIEAFLIEYDAQGGRFDAYIRERLEDLEMNAETELQKRGLEDFQQPGFYLTFPRLDKAFPQGATRAKAFFYKDDTTSMELLMFRMFEKEVEELLLTYRTSMRFRAHDALEA